MNATSDFRPQGGIAPPSLLGSASHTARPASEDGLRILSALQSSKPKRPATASRRGRWWTCAALLMAISLIGGTYALSGRLSSAASQQAAAPAPAMAQPTEASRGDAAITSVPAPATPPATPAAATIVDTVDSAPLPAASASAPSSALPVTAPPEHKVADAKGASAAKPAARRSPPHKAKAEAKQPATKDADVDLIEAMISHMEGKNTPEPAGAKKPGTRPAAPSSRNVP